MNGEVKAACCPGSFRGLSIGLQDATVEEISTVTGGLRLLQALAAAEAASAEAMPGPEAKVNLDVLWIFIGKVGLLDGVHFCNCHVACPA